MLHRPLNRSPNQVWLLVLWVVTTWWFGSCVIAQEEATADNETSPVEAVEENLDTEPATDETETTADTQEEAATEDQTEKENQDADESTDEPYEFEPSEDISEDNAVDFPHDI